MSDKPHQTGYGTLADFNRDPDAITVAIFDGWLRIRSGAFGRQWAEFPVQFEEGD